MKSLNEIYLNFVFMLLEIKKNNWKHNILSFFKTNVRLLDLIGFLKQISSKIGDK